MRVAQDRAAHAVQSGLAVARGGGIASGLAPVHVRRNDPRAAIARRAIARSACMATLVRVSGVAIALGVVEVVMVVVVAVTMTGAVIVGERDQVVDRASVPGVDVSPVAARVLVLVHGVARQRRGDDAGKERRHEESLATGRESRRAHATAWEIQENIERSDEKMRATIAHPAVRRKHRRRIFFASRPVC